MIKEVMDFCVYGTMLEDYYKLSKDDLMSKEEFKKLSEIINKEIGVLSNDEVLELYKKKFREIVDNMLLKFN